MPYDLSKRKKFQAFWFLRTCILAGKKLQLVLAAFLTRKTTGMQTK